MKKLVMIAAALLLVAGGAFAQKGKKYIGTSIMLPSQQNVSSRISEGNGFATGVTYRKSGDVKITTVGVTPDFGYFLSDNLAVGVALGYTHESNENGITQGTKVSTNAYGINPYARYFFHTSERLSLFLQPGVLYSTNKVGDADASHVFYAGIQPGLEYKLSDKFDFVGHIGNVGYFDYGNSTSAFEFNLNMSTINLGVVYVF